jgi:hypothetical protein
MSSALIAILAGATMVISHNLAKPDPAPEPVPAPVYETCAASAGGECELEKTLVYKASADWGVVNVDMPSVFYSASLPAANGEAYVARGICSAKGYSLPTVEQLKWMADNAQAMGAYALKDGLYWADKLSSPTTPLTLSAIAVNGQSGDIVPVAMTQELLVRCVTDMPEAVADEASAEVDTADSAE